MPVFRKLYVSNPIGRLCGPRSLRNNRAANKAGSLPSPAAHRIIRILWTKTIRLDRLIAAAQSFPCFVNKKGKFGIRPTHCRVLSFSLRSFSMSMRERKMPKSYQPNTAKVFRELLTEFEPRDVHTSLAAVSHWALRVSFRVSPATARAQGDPLCVSSGKLPLLLLKNRSMSWTASGPRLRPESRLPFPQQPRDFPPDKL